MHCQSVSLVKPRAAEKRIPRKGWVDEERPASVIFAQREREVRISGRCERNPHGHPFPVPFLPCSWRALVQRPGFEADAQRPIILHGDWRVVAQTNVSGIRTWLESVGAAKNCATGRVVDQCHT